LLVASTYLQRLLKMSLFRARIIDYLNLANLAFSYVGAFGVRVDIASAAQNVR
jgi:hypothetical protein